MYIFWSLLYGIVMGTFFTTASCESYKSALPDFQDIFWTFQYDNAAYKQQLETLRKERRLSEACRYSIRVLGTALKEKEYEGTDFDYLRELVERVSAPFNRLHVELAGHEVQLKFPIAKVPSRMSWSAAGSIFGAVVFQIISWMGRKELAKREGPRVGLEMEEMEVEKVDEDEDWIKPKVEGKETENVEAPAQT